MAPPGILTASEGEASCCLHVSTSGSPWDGPSATTPPPRWSDRGRLAEAAAWTAARAPDLEDDERAFREAVAVRVSRMFAFVGSDRQH